MPCFADWIGRLQRCKWLQHYQIFDARYLITLGYFSSEAVHCAHCLTTPKTARYHQPERWLPLGGGRRGEADGHAGRLRATHGGNYRTYSRAVDRLGGRIPVSRSPGRANLDRTPPNTASREYEWISDLPLNANPRYSPHINFIRLRSSRRQDAENAVTADPHLRQHRRGSRRSRPAATTWLPSRPDRSAWRATRRGGVAVYLRPVHDRVAAPLSGCIRVLPPDDASCHTTLRRSSMPSATPRRSAGIGPPR